MRVLLSILRFQPGKTFGAETYLKALLVALSELREDVEIVVAGSRLGTAWVKRIAPNLPTYSAHSLENSIAATCFEWLVIRKVIAAQRPDVVFFPFNTMPPVAIPSVLMVHDLVSFFYARHFPRAVPLRFQVLSILVRRSVQRATVIVTPTLAIAEEVRERIRGAPKLIIPVPEAAEPQYAASAPPMLSLGYREQHLLLQTGSKLPHKAQHLGLCAFRQLLDAVPDLIGRVRLVVTGCGMRDGRELMRLVEGEAAAHYVTFLGRVSEEELAALNKRATAVLFPTLYEGFGLGVVEAQASGNAVVASDIPVLREVSGGHAEFFTPGSSFHMATAIRRILTDEVRRSHLQQQGLVNAMAWSWKQHARRLLDILRQAAET